MTQQTPTKNSSQQTGLKRNMTLSRWFVLLALLWLQAVALHAQSGAEQQLLEMANQSRAAAGLGPLQWDQALANAAYAHCRLMAQAHAIGHQYAGEANLAVRAGQSGAHFRRIEENVAYGPDAATIHQGWMQSPGHRANLLNGSVDRVGIAVLQAPGGIYAVADYAQATISLTRSQVESVLTDFLRAKGLEVDNGAAEAREYCAGAGKYSGAGRPNFLMQWQTADITDFPEPLIRQLKTGKYRRAAVGGCPVSGGKSGFTVYGVGVLLYQ